MEFEKLSKSRSLSLRNWKCHFNVFFPTQAKKGVGTVDFFSFFFFNVEYNCFTMRLVSAVQQSDSVLCIHICPALALPPTPLGDHGALTTHPHPAPLGGHGPRAPVCFAQRVYVSGLLSWFIPASPSSPESTHPFSTSAPLFLLCQYVHLDHFGDGRFLKATWYSLRPLSSSFESFWV